MEKSIQNLYQITLKALKDGSVENHDTVALFIIESVFSDKYLNLMSKTYESNQEQKVKQATQQYLHGTPLAYIFNQASFRNNQYYICPGVLIPRPETEELVDITVSLLNQLNQGNLSIIELGIGSGVISLELALEFPQFSFTGWDISKTAIDVSTKNKQQLNIENVSIKHGNFFDSINELPKLSPTLMVSNPPYISHDEYKSLDKYVLNEPKEALVAENDGLEIITKSIDICIKNDIIYIAEIGYKQHDLLLQHFQNESLIFLKDLTGYNRFVAFIPKNKKWSDNLINFLIQLNK